MKKQCKLMSILLALVMALTLAPTMALPTAEAASDVAINATNFPDETFRNYVKDNFDTNGNGKLSAPEIADVTEIVVQFREIASLRGVEYLTALEVLDCSYNQLTALDVSKNTALERLYCYDNQLTTLDVSKNTALTDLVCEGNQLTSLDVSKNTKLGTLGCSNNQLTSLDVSKNKALVSLFCEGNQLTSLDVSKNTVLRYLDCSNNQLTALDVSKNTNLGDLGCSNNQLTALDVYKNTDLEYLFCSNNQLTALDVSKNTALGFLGCQNNGLTALDVSKNTALGYLSCYDNQLTALDVSKNTALERLYCYDNQLTTLDVSKNTALTNLVCKGNQLTSLDVSKNTKLGTLGCSNNQLTSLDVSKNKALVSLFCEGNQLTSLDVSKNTNLGDLGCSNNQLTALDVYKNTDLEYLFCSNNQLTALDVSKNTVLRYLDCSNNQLTTLYISKCPRLIEAYVYATKTEYEFDGTVIWAYDYYGSYLCVDPTTAVMTSASKPAISNQPADKSAKVGDSVKFTVAATGGELTYRWQYKTPTGTWKNSGATGYNTPTLTISAATSRNGYQYRCVVENEKGKAISKAATLTVKPKITNQPTDKSGYVGGTVKFTVAAKGDGLTYRWQYYNGSAWKNSGLTGHDTATLSVGVTAARNGQQYRCVVTDKNGNKTISSTAKLIVKPKITAQPANKTASTGTTVKFTVKATGAGLTYRWQYRTSSTGSWKNSTLTGHDTATLTVSATAARNGYQYRCVIVDANGTKLISTAATLTVK